MQFMLLIFESETQWDARTPAQRSEIYEEYGTFAKAIRASGHFKAGDALHPAPAAKSVRVKDGRTIVTDGPFAETREQLGGYYVIEARDLEEATAIAARIPTARHGTIEVRAVQAMNM